PEIEYFKAHPVLRKGDVVNTSVKESQDAQPSASDAQFVQGNSLKINSTTINKLYLIGEYRNESVKILDESNQLVKTISLNMTTQGMYDIFHELDLSFLPSNKKYTLQSSAPVTGLLKDGNAATLSLNTHSDKTYYLDEPLNLEVKLNEWTDAFSSTIVKGYLNRNIDEKGRVIYDQLIPVDFEYNETLQSFICKTKVALPCGVYNVSVFAEGNELKRFATTSILMKQERRPAVSENLFSVFPNPASSNVTVQFNAEENSNYSIEAFDIVGKKIMQKEASNLSGMQQIQLSLKDAAKGSYLISFSVNGERKSSKVLLLN
ncbi:MAG: T9SS type A sorting domain-containing protein, partial [Chitinophagales bacterium]|nr:T9SS type A sorting domain-containing protein [Chitinophagales bacterium]